MDANVLGASWGGIPKYIHRIVEELVAGGDRVDLLANRWRWTSPIAGAGAVGLRVKGLTPWRNAALPLWTLAHRPDVLWAPATVLPLHAGGVATVATVHDLAPLLFPGSKTAQETRSFETVIPRSVRSATRVICVSETTAADVRRVWGVSGDRLRVVPNGVDTRFTPGDHEQARAAVAARHGLREPFVLHVGSLEPRKGLDVLIAAAARRPPWRLVLAGKPAYLGEGLAADAARAGAMLLEDVDDDGLVDLYRAAEVVAVPSIYEGFGIVPLEAMACGTPVVIAENAGALEEVCGDAALRVAQRTPEAWTAGIEQARTQRAGLAAAGVARAGLFGWPAVARATRDVLAEAAESHRRPRGR